MEDEIKSRFDEADKRLLSTEKRIDDIKWFIGGLATLFTVGFSVLTLILSWNYSNERASLRDFQRDLRADLGKIEQAPELLILGTNGAELSGQEINATVVKDKAGDSKITIPSVYRNKGLGTTGPLYVKIHTRKPLALDSRSTDEPDFEFELYIEPKDIQPSELPGQYTTAQESWFYLVGRVPPKPGKHPVLMKVFYGKGKVARAGFTIVIPEVK
jgi:hypothetical protein